MVASSAGETVLNALNALDRSICTLEITMVTTPPASTALQRTPTYYLKAREVTPEYVTTARTPTPIA